MLISSSMHSSFKITNSGIKSTSSIVSLSQKEEAIEDSFSRRGIQKHTKGFQHTNKAILFLTLYQSYDSAHSAWEKPATHALQQ